jgi:hypothetical protein
MPGHHSPEHGERRGQTPYCGKNEKVVYLLTIYTKTLPNIIYLIFMLFII